MIHPLAGKSAPPSLLVDLAGLERAYYADHPDPSLAAECVSFGTSGHRGTPLRRSFNEDHIVAISASIADHRSSRGIDGPLLLGVDTHAVSIPAARTAVEVLAARGIEVWVAASGGYTPTPSISHAILTFNRSQTRSLADGIVVTPSHNPPEDGGFKYNPPHGGPAEEDITRGIEARANELLRAGVASIGRVPYERAVREGRVKEHDFVTPYVTSLASVVDVDAIARSGIRIGIDPMGGASVGYWGPIVTHYGFNATVVNTRVDKTFAFMPLDHDGKIRTDCSSPYAMANLIALKDKFDIAFGNDGDADRHGIVTREGLMSPNHYLAAAIDYLFSSRTAWPAAAAVGKTMVSSSVIDRVAAALGRKLYEVPVGFKWFVAGLHGGTLGFGGEESAGASFLRKDASVWTTDKDGILLDLLAAEILAKTGQDPAARYRAIEQKLGASAYARVDSPASAEVRAKLKSIRPEAVNSQTLAGDPIRALLNKAPGNGADFGGLKVVSDQAWFATRPSGTEDVYKLYGESFRGAEHLAMVLSEARAIIRSATA